MGYIGVITHLLTFYSLPGTSKWGSHRIPWMDQWFSDYLETSSLSSMERTVYLPTFGLFFNGKCMVNIPVPWIVWGWNTRLPKKAIWNPRNEGLEDDVPFQRGWFSGSILVSCFGEYWFWNETPFKYAFVGQSAPSLWIFWPLSYVCSYSINPWSWICLRWFFFTLYHSKSPLNHHHLGEYCFVTFSKNQTFKQILSG